MKVSVIVAHPDDEVLGVGGTILKHVAAGDEVSVLILSDGKSSRVEKFENYDTALFEYYAEETKEVNDILGVKRSKLFNLAGNRLDRYDLLDLIKIVQKEVDEFQPEIIYTHYHKDLNIDHCQVSRAVITAARPLPGTSVKEILMFETLSSTEYALALGESFCPKVFIDISPYLETKLKAMSCYKSELRELPHPRNLEMIRKNAELWGAKAGMHAAEVFDVARMLR